MKATFNKTGEFLLIVLQHILFTVLFTIAFFYLFGRMDNLCLYVIENFSWFDWSDSTYSIKGNMSIERIGIWVGIIILAIGMGIIRAISYFIQAKYAPIIAGIIAHIIFAYSLGMAYEYQHWLALIIYFIVMYITVWIAIGTTFIQD